jgi:phosphate-selective porin OprO and OprP
MTNKTPEILKRIRYLFSLLMVALALNSVVFPLPMLAGVAATEFQSDPTFPTNPAAEVFLRPAPPQNTAEVFLRPTNSQNTAEVILRPTNSQNTAEVFLRTTNSQNTAEVFLRPAPPQNTAAETSTPDTIATASRFIDDDIRFPSLPYYSYRAGLGLTSPDSTFRLNIRFRMQNRASLKMNDGTDDEFEGIVRRLRLRFDGFVGDPRFLYAIQLSFAPGDVGTLREGENLNVIRDAVFFYRPNNRINLGFGQTKLPGNRQRVNSSGALQLTDRSINNARFTIDRDYGFHFNYLNEDEEAFSWNLRTAVSSGNGRNWTRNLNTGLAYTARVELQPLGAFRDGGMFFEGDLKRELRPKVMVGLTYHFNDDAQRTQGQTGGTLFDTRDLTSVFFDAMLKYRGFSATYAFMDPLGVGPAFYSRAHQRINRNRYTARLHLTTR